MRFQLRQLGPTAVAAVALSALVAGTQRGHAAAGDATMEMPRYTADGALVFPGDYREWQFVTAGHGMNYSETAANTDGAPFDNVFVQRGAYAAFKATGHWPEGTMLVLEIRGGTSKGSINKHGAFQQGAPIGREVHVRDQRFKGGWGFFGAENAEAPQKANFIAYTSNCYACHQANAAVDTTFVQFYPTLLPIARAKATVSEAFLKEEAAARP